MQLPAGNIFQIKKKEIKRPCDWSLLDKFKEKQGEKRGWIRLNMKGTERK